MKQLVTFTLLMITFLSVFAQEAIDEKEEIITIDTPKSIKDQFEFIYNKSNNYAEFKVVKKNWLTKLKLQTVDSIRSVASELNAAELKIKNQKADIFQLNNNLDAVKNELITVTEEKDVMPFLGMNLTKTSYSTIIWSIIGLLLVLLGFFIFKFKRSNVITKEAQHGLKELELEFEDHRRRSLEREQKVMRKLQDELNKKK